MSSNYLIGAVTLLYMGVAVNEVLNGSKAMAIVWFGYSIANVGLMLEVLWRIR
jgi:hypothetical protein